MSNQYKGKNQMLYLWEGIACILVVFIHCRFPGNVGLFIETIARFAVPFFFAVSGYFWIGEHENVEKKAIRKIKKILCIFIITLIVYLACRIVAGQFNMADLTILDLAKLILFNSTDFVSGPLWFLLALVYCYVIFIIIDKINCYKILPIAAFVLLGVHYIFKIIVTKNSYALMGYSLSDYIFYRNWLLMAFPFFSIGYFIKTKSEWIDSKLNRLPASVLIVVGSFLSVIERLVLHIEMDFYIGSLMMLIGIFVLSLNKSETKVGKLLQYLGENCTLMIYISHSLIMYVLRFVIAKLNLGETAIVLWTLPIVVMMSSVIFAVLFSKFEKIFYKKKVF